MDKVFEFAAKVNSIWTIASFAIAIVLYIALKGKQKAWVIVVAVGAVVVLGLVPIIVNFFSQKIYQIRVTVIDPSGSPTDDAKVSSSLGGEAKQVGGGWELDINPQSIPQDKKISIYAKQKDAFATASKDTILGTDYNFAIILKLKNDASAKIGGTVIDGDQHGLDSATVYVDGFKNESTITKNGGTFTLSSHTAKDDKVRLYVNKKGYKETNDYYQAGDDKVSISLKK